MSQAWAKGSTTRWRRIRAYVLDRDGWVCRLCWESIDPAVPYPEDMSAAVHHTLGKAATGDDPRYLEAAHKLCNERAGNPATTTDPKPVSQTRW